MKINFVGDIGLFRRYEQLGIDPFREIQLPPSDFNIGNFEFIIPAGGRKLFFDVQEHYSCSPEYLGKLEVNRFHGLGLANNHAMDWGLEGYLATSELLEDSGIQLFGFSREEPYSIGTFEKDGISAGIIGCVKRGRWSREHFGYGPDSCDPDAVTALIGELRRRYNHVVVFPHWGTELVDIPDPDCTRDAKRFIDAGASAVVGHHPHVPQGIEQYGGGLIAYSLGSFIYIPGEELGSSRAQQNREISICLSIEFSADAILSHRAHYYRFDRQGLVPRRQSPESLNSYIDHLDSNIYNKKAYRKQVRRVLLKRELRSFWKRFSSRPARTLVHYARYVKPGQIRKIVR